MPKVDPTNTRKIAKELGRTGQYDITWHAQVRANERNFDLAQVPKILEMGERAELPTGVNEWVLDPKKLGSRSNYAMAVVTVPDYGVQIVKTVYWVEWTLWRWTQKTKRQPGGSHQWI
ncbi:MAG: hypothetical protein CMJ72_06915 [Planctomycetaceae bacterium]|nr:hypothetical protein [Planctomycetaceae bacterium]